MRKLCVFSVGAKDINKNVNCKIVFFGSPKFARFIDDYHNEYRANAFYFIRETINIVMPIEDSFI